jgi:hypothetical protein
MATNGHLNHRLVATLAVALAAVSFAATTAGESAAASSGACGCTIHVPILMYHRINVINARTPAISRRLTVSPAVFAHQLA